MSGCSNKPYLVIYIFTYLETTAKKMIDEPYLDFEKLTDAL